MIHVDQLMTPNIKTLPVFGVEFRARGALRD
jgi:hypothetical protein